LKLLVSNRYTLFLFFETGESKEMAKLILTGLTLSLAFLGLAACGDNTANTNTNRIMNTNTANMNANMTNANLSNANMSNMNNEVSSAADQFMTTAAQDGMMEVELGKLAASKAQNPEIKAFGQKMVVDHGKANDELKALAAKKNIKLPTEISGGMKETVDRLSKLSGAEFDKEYVKLMVDAHDEDVEAFQTQAENAADADVKAFAQKTLPVLKSHYETIKKINDNMK
jgi:putative membrane protein